MIPGPNVSFVGFAVASVLLLAALVLLRYRRYRAGLTPHCRRCDYDLTANTSAVCPECGAALTPGSIAVGDLTRHAGRLGLGLVLLVPALALGAIAGTSFVRQFDAYRLRPTTWVIEDAESQQVPLARRAWDELARRRAGRPLADAHEARLTRFALGEQARARSANPSPPVSPILQDLINYLGDRTLDGKLDDAQRKQFFEATLTPKLRLRRLVRAGDACPIEFSLAAAGPNSGGWWYEETGGSIVAAGREVPVGGRSTFSGTGSGGSTMQTLRTLPPGDHPVTLKQTVRAYHGPSSDASRSRLFHEWTLTRAATLRVVDPEPPGTFKLLDRPDLAPAIRAAISVRHLGYRNRTSRSVEVSIGLSRPPENVAFTVTARAAGKEYDLGSVYVAKSGQTTWLMSGDALRDFTGDKLNLVFRSSEKTARGTIDLFDIWNGEIVLENVPFTPRPK